MNRMMAARALIAALLLGLAATTLTAAPATARAEMSETRAGRYYMQIACPLGAAANTFYKKVWKGRQTISKREVRRRLPELKKLTKAYANADAKFARRLFNPPADWPQEVSSLVNRLANKHVTYSTRRFKQAAAVNAGQWLYWNGQSNNVDFGTLAARIRAKLDLPPTGQGC